MSTGAARGQRAPSAVTIAYRRHSSGQQWTQRTDIAGWRVSRSGQRSEGLLVPQGLLLQNGSPVTSRRSSVSGIGLDDNRSSLGSPYGQPPCLPVPHNGSSNDVTLPAQMSALHVSPPPSADTARVLPRNRDCRVDLGSEVYKMLREPAEPVASEPKQSGSFRYLQGMLEAGEGGERPGPGGPRNLKPAASKLGAPLSGLQGLPECTRCGHGIVGTIVKARDKLYHPECFMCSDCGLNLKQRGYFFLDERLYCENHAKARVKPPEGYDVVAVYPNAKVELV